MLETTSPSIRLLQGNYALDLLVERKLYVLRGCSTRLLFSESNNYIFMQEGLSHSVRFWGRIAITENALFITTLPWHHTLDNFLAIAEIISKTQPLGISTLSQFLICCNSYSEVLDAKQAGFVNAILCNQNAFLDHAIFNISNTSKRSYYLCLNSRPEKWKRPWYAAGIRNLAIIRGALYQPEQYYAFESLEPAYINERPLLPAEVAQVLGNSEVGAIFSETEGACYSSGEFLLCGLPVISTPCRGGRELYYNEDNSIIVEEKKEVIPALVSLINRLRLQPELRQTIRNRHLNLSKRMIERLCNRVDSIIAHKNGGSVQVKFEHILSAQYRNKMILYSSCQELFRALDIT